MSTLSRWFWWVSTTIIVIIAALWYIQMFRGREIQLTVTDRIQEEGTTAYVVALRYPEFSGSAVTEAANAMLQEALIRVKEDFIVNAESLRQEIRAGRPSELSIGYDVAYSTSKLISIRFSVFDQTAGAAHPNSYSLVFNYAPALGRTIRVGELFKASEAPLPVLAGIARESLTAQLAAKEVTGWLDEGLALRQENYSRFTVSTDGLRLIFDPYQIAPYVAGEFDVFVPWERVRAILEPTAPLPPGALNGR